MLQEENQADKLIEELRCEVNLLRYPFFGLRNNDVTDRSQIDLRKTAKRNEETVEIVWNVSANTRYGFPGPFDKKVHHSIEQVIEETNLPISNPIQFSIYELCKRINISPGGSNYKKIKEAIERLVTTSIKSKMTFYHKGKKKWIDRTFHLYDTIIYKGEELDGGEIAETNYLYLNDLYLESINARYVKPIDFQYYKGLRTNIARRLYELLGVKFFGIHNNGHSFIRYKYSTICELVPLTQQKFTSDIRRQLDPAHQELKKTEFLDDVQWKPVSDKSKNWYILYYPGERAEAEINHFNNSTSTRSIGGSKLPSLSPAQEASVGGWVNELTQKLEDEAGENEGYYKKLAKLIVKGKLPENLVRQCLSETKSEDQMRQRDPEAEQIENRSAYFTDMLKRRLKEKNKDLSKLL